MDFDYGKLLSEFPASIEIEAGHYYLVTGNRQADGSVLSSLSFFDVPEGITTEIKVTTRESKSKTKPWGKVNLANFSLENINNKKETAARMSGNAGVLLIWIDPDKEPSKHVMADLPAVKALLDKWDGEVVFLLQKDKVTKSFNPENFKNLPTRTSYVYDLNSKFIQEISKMKGHDLTKNLPVVIVSDFAGAVLSRPLLYNVAGGVGRAALRKPNAWLVYNRFNPWGRQREMPLPPKRNLPPVAFPSIAR